MKNQFDENLYSVFDEKLSHIHASEDLINRTLLEIRKEIGEETASTKNSLLSPINNNHISRHIEKIKKQRGRIYTLAGVLTIAATILIVNTTLLATYKTSKVSNAETNITETYRPRSRNSARINVWIDRNGGVHKEYINPYTFSGLNTKHEQTRLSQNFMYEECLDEITDIEEC